MTESESRAGPHFRTSSFSAAGSCVEVAQLEDGSIAVRNSRTATAALVFAGDEWAAFLAGVKAGEFDF